MIRRKKMLATGLATAVSAVGLVGALAAPASAAGTVDCQGWVHAVDPDMGVAGCTNNTDRSVQFRVEVVCGLAPDVHGDWVTLNPGQYSESRATCGALSSGVGSVGWSIQ